VRRPRHRRKDSIRSASDGPVGKGSYPRNSMARDTIRSPRRTLSQKGSYRSGEEWASGSGTQPRRRRSVQLGAGETQDHRRTPEKSRRISPGLARVEHFGDVRSSRFLTVLLPYHIFVSRWLEKR
jgi:hypothetical protein